MTQTFDPAVYAMELRRIAATIEDGSDWLDAIDAVLPSRKEAADLRHEIEYAFQADGGRLYDGPTDDSALYWISSFADDQERYVASLARIEARKVKP